MYFVYALANVSHMLWPMWEISRSIHSKIDQNELNTDNDVRMCEYMDAEWTPMYVIIRKHWSMVCAYEGRKKCTQNFRMSDWRWPRYKTSGVLKRWVVAKADTYHIMDERYITWSCYQCSINQVVSSYSTYDAKAVSLFLPITETLRHKSANNQRTKFQSEAKRNETEQTQRIETQHRNEHGFS